MDQGLLWTDLLRFSLYRSAFFSLFSSNVHWKSVILCQQYKWALYVLFVVEGCLIVLFWSSIVHVTPKGVNVLVVWFDSKQIMSVIITLVKGEHLIAADITGRSDPYVVLTIGNSKKKSRHKVFFFFCKLSHPN